MIIIVFNCPHAFLGDLRGIHYIRRHRDEPKTCRRLTMYDIKSLKETAILDGMKLSVNQFEGKGCHTGWLFFFGYLELNECQIVPGGQFEL